MRVSKEASSRLEDEWTALDVLLKGRHKLITPQDGCECEIILRFGLACRQYPKKAYDEASQLPKR